MADDSANATTDAEGSTPTRSPSFPFIDLEAAIERAQQFYEAEHRNAAPSDVAVSHWGYTPKSSGGKQTLGALRAYGLLTGTGRVSLTSRALKIVVLGAPDRDKAIQEAALAPEEFNKLWTKHGQELPSDQSLRHELLINRGFNDNAVDRFINNYKTTVAFARLGDSDTMSLADEDTEQTNAPLRGSSMQAQVVSPKPASAAAPAFATEVPPVTFPLPRGNVVEIRLKSRVTPAEFEQLTQLWKLLGPSLIEQRKEGEREGEK